MLGPSFIPRTNGQDHCHPLCLGRIRECNHLLFREKFIPILSFNVSGKTKASESSNSCPWCLLHKAKELEISSKEGINQAHLVKRNRVKSRQCDYFFRWVKASPEIRPSLRH